MKKFKKYIWTDGSISLPAIDSEECPSEQQQGRGTKDLGGAIMTWDNGYDGDRYMPFSTSSGTYWIDKMQFEFTGTEGTKVIFKTKHLNPSIKAGQEYYFDLEHLLEPKIEDDTGSANVVLKGTGPLFAFKYNHFPTVYLAVRLAGFIRYVIRETIKSRLPDLIESNRCFIGTEQNGNSFKPEDAPNGRPDSFWAWKGTDGHVSIMGDLYVGCTRAISAVMKSGDLRCNMHEMGIFDSFWRRWEKYLYSGKVFHASNLPFGSDARNYLDMWEENAAVLNEDESLLFRVFDMDSLIDDAIKRAEKREATSLKRGMIRRPDIQ